MNKKLLGLYGLKFNPFSQQVPPTALLVTPQIESFCWSLLLWPPASQVRAKAPLCAFSPNA